MGPPLSKVNDYNFVIVLFVDTINYWRFPVSALFFDGKMGVTTLVENGQQSTKARDTQSFVIYPGERHVGFVYCDDGKGKFSMLLLKLHN